MDEQTRKLLDAGFSPIDIGTDIGARVKMREYQAALQRPTGQSSESLQQLRTAYENTCQELSEHLERGGQLTHARRLRGLMDSVEVGLAAKDNQSQQTEDVQPKHQAKQHGFSWTNRVGDFLRQHLPFGG